MFLPCGSCCETDACSGGFSYSDPLDEGQWIPSGQWFNVPFAGRTTVTGTFNPAARGKVWFFYGSHGTSSADGSATVSEREDYENPCNWWSYMNTDPFQLAGSPQPGLWRRATSLPPSDATVFFRTKCVWTGTKTLAAAYFMGTNLFANLTCTGLAHDSPGGVVFCNAGPQAGVTLNSGATFGPGTILANATINGNVSLRATSNTLNPNYVNGDMATGPNSQPNVNGSQITGNLSIQYRGTFTNITVGGDVTVYESPYLNTPTITGNLNILYAGTAAVSGGTVGGTTTMNGGNLYNPTLTGLLTMSGGSFYGTANGGITATGGRIAPPTTTTTINASGSTLIGGNTANLDSPSALITANQINLTDNCYLYEATCNAQVTAGGNAKIGYTNFSAVKPVRCLKPATFNGSALVHVTDFWEGPVTFNDSTQVSNSGFGKYTDESLTVHAVMNGNSRANQFVTVYGTNGTVTFNDNACTTVRYQTPTWCPPPTNNYLFKFGFGDTKTICNGTAPTAQCGVSTSCGCG